MTCKNVGGFAAVRTFVFITLGFTLGSSLPLAAQSGTWKSTGALNTARAMHTATLLANGQVLVVGGIDASSRNPLASVELYNPATGVFTVTGSMSQAREAHTATLLPNGEVLVAGGTSGLGSCTSTAELYSPATGRWATTGSMTQSRCGQTATLLSNGQVLVAGGCCDSSNGDLATAELYSPMTGTWQATGSLNAVRTNAAAALLANGEVLVAGGTNNANGSYTFLTSTEIYNPTQGSWQMAQSLNSGSGLTATLLGNGDVLVLGGPAEFSDPLVHSWTNTGSYPRIAAVAGGHAATLLGTGEVLVTGTHCNYSGCHVLTSTAAFLYSVSGNSWSVTGAMNHPRAYHTATLLTNGQVLVTGGQSGDPVTIVGTAELYTP